jgi:aspartate-semialdehyde dehydrogenase
VTVLADRRPTCTRPGWRRPAATGSDGVFVGRIRANLAEPQAVLFGSVADAHGRGLNAIQIAEFLPGESLD